MSPPVDTEPPKGVLYPGCGYIRACANKPNGAILHNVFTLLAIILLLNLATFSDLGLWPAAWLLPIALLVLLRNHSHWSIWLGAWVLLSVGTIVGMRGMIPLPTPFAEIFLAVMSITSLIPFFLDKRFYSRVKDFRSTFVLPAAAATLEFINVASSPWGSWGAVANTQIENAVVAQLASVTGLAGITFLIYWTATVGLYLWERRPAQRSKFSREFIRAALSLALVLNLVIGYGGYRLATTPESNSLKVGVVLVGNLNMMKQLYEDYSGKSLDITDKTNQGAPQLRDFNTAMIAVIENPDEDRFRKTRAVFKANEDQAFALAGKAVQQGAQVISWYEGQFMTFAGQQQPLIARGQEFAQRHKVMLFMPMAIFTPGKITPGKKFMQNQVLVIDREGKVVYTYHKSMPVRGVEPVEPGDGVIPAIPFNGTSVSPVICYDADFPRLIRQVGMKETGILLIPSGDWYDIRYSHRDMSRFRAIENGVNIVRPASRGISSIIDSRGRLLATLDYFNVAERLLVADVPTRGDRTLYARIGDSFAWLVVAGLALLLLNYIAIRRRSPRQA